MKSTRGGQWCAGIECRNARFKNHGMSFFRFPKDPERCKKWVINTRRKDLLDKASLTLYNNYVLCSDHFDKSQFMNPATRKGGLIHCAVPTLFNVPNSPKKDIPTRSLLEGRKLAISNETSGSTSAISSSAISLIQCTSSSPPGRFIGTSVRSYKKPDKSPKKLAQEKKISALRQKLYRHSRKVKTSNKPPKVTISGSKEMLSEHLRGQTIDFVMKQVELGGKSSHGHTYKEMADEDQGRTHSRHSSSLATPNISNPGTPCSEVSQDVRATPPLARATPPLARATPPLARATPPLGQDQPQLPHGPPVIPVRSITQAPTTASPLGQIHHQNKEMADEDQSRTHSRHSSSPATPNVSNPGTPCSEVSQDVRATRSLARVTPSLARATPPLAKATPPLGQGQPQLPAPVRSITQTPTTASPLGQIHHQSKYASLLAVIEDMDRDIRPTYAGNRSSIERLKRSIVHARILVRECLMECERSART